MNQDFFHCDAFVILKSLPMIFAPHYEIYSPENESEKEIIC